MSKFVVHRLQRCRLIDKRGVRQIDIVRRLLVPPPRGEVSMRTNQIPNGKKCHGGTCPF